MGAATNYETSSTYMGGYVKALRGLELLTPEVMAKFEAPQRQMVASPYSQGWWPGAETEVITRAVLDVHGAAKVEEVGLLTTRNGVGPIISPLISVIGAFFGLEPSTLFERMNDLSSTSIRGITLEWASTGRRAGTLRVGYPEGLGGATVEPLWRGACRYVFETAHAKAGQLSSQVTGSAIELSLRW